MDGLSYSEALNALKHGKSVRRASWNYNDFVLLIDEEPYDKDLGTMRNAYFQYHNVLEGRVSMWVPTTADLLAEDWQIMSLDTDTICESPVSMKFELDITGTYKRFLGDKFSQACAEGTVEELVAKAARSVLFENVNTVNIKVKRLDK